jgi:SAM-dependent methyltransferase
MRLPRRGAALGSLAPPLCGLTLGHAESHDAPRAVTLGGHRAGSRGWGVTQFQVCAEDKARAARYFQSHSDAYNRRVERGALKHLRARERRALFELVEFEDPSVATMIDVGCGGGVYALAAKAAGLRVTAVDVCSGMIDNLKGKVDQALVGDMECLHLEARYDVVVCSGALDYVVHPKVAFRNLCDLVLPGGRLVIQVPRGSVGGRLYSVGVRACCGFRINLFTVRWLTRQANRWGLELIRFQRPLPYNLVALFRRPAALPAD